MYFILDFYSLCRSKKKEKKREKKEAQKELMEDAASEELREKQESSTGIHSKESET